MMAENLSAARLGRPPKELGLDTKSRILDVALDLFAARGYAGTSIRRIARAVGVSESAIYAHFDGKQKIYDTLFAETGPSVALSIFDAKDRAETDAPPEVLLRQLGRRMIAAWDNPRARLFMSVFMREGALGSLKGSTGLTTVIEQVQSQVGKLFRKWMDAGLIRDDFPPQHLVWEMIAPLANVRFLYLHAQATEAERRTGRQLAERHLDYFLACVLREPEPRKNLPKRKGPGMSWRRTRPHPAQGS